MICELFSGNKVHLSRSVNVKRGHHRFVGNTNTLFFGEKTTIGNAYFLIDGGTEVKFGKDCMVSYQSVFRTTDAHSLFDTNSGELINQPNSIILGNHVWVGQGALIMQGVSLGDNIVVGTRALVTKSFNQEYIAVAGVPAKVVRENVLWGRESPAK